MTRCDLSYSDIMKLMTDRYSLNLPLIKFEELSQEIIIKDFFSNAHNNLPGEDEHIRRNPAFLALLKFYLSRSLAANKEIFNSLKTPDKDIPENNSFKYPVLINSNQKPAERIILLLHGLNERSWIKYLPWASGLSRKTGSAVILFPIAFHMNRSPAAWSDIRRMMPVVRERKGLLPDLEGGSFANAAISYRMQFAPQRFMLTGMQTFMDVVSLISMIKDGEYPELSPGASVNLFAYSIGATLAEILMMGNPRGYFSRSRAFLFCGGPALDLATPVNRAIIDNHAFSSLLQLFNDTLNGTTDELKSLEHGTGNNAYRYLKSLLIFNRMNEERDSRFMELQDRIRVLALEEDQVMSPCALEKTFSESGIPVETASFPYKYTHENPFPVIYGDDADCALDSVITKAAEFYL